MRDLQAQRGVLALAQRFLILHASKAVALMMFWAAMAQPGAIGWLLLGGKPPMQVFIVSPSDHVSLSASCCYLTEQLMQKYIGVTDCCDSCI